MLEIGKAHATAHRSTRNHRTRIERLERSQQGTQRFLFCRILCVPKIRFCNIDWVKARRRRRGAQSRVPAPPYERALAHPKLSKAVNRRLREIYRALDPVALLAEMRDAQAEPGTRLGGPPGKLAAAAS